MAFAYVGGDGQWTVEEQLGGAFFSHKRAAQPRLRAGQAGLVDGRTVMEFSLPLSLANAKTIGSTEALPYILAFHKDKTGFSKHTKRSGGTMILQPPAPR
jgi:hypothetical protein